MRRLHGAMGHPCLFIELVKHHGPQNLESFPAGFRCRINICIMN